MTKTCFVCLFLFVLASPLWAAQNKNGLRDLAVSETFRYAENLYNRKDHTAATDAFQRVLAMQPGHQGALAYLEKMQVQPRVDYCDHSVSKPVHVTPIAPIAIDPNATNADIKQDIAAEDAAIAVLTQELAQLQAQGEASPYAQE